MFMISFSRIVMHFVSKNFRIADFSLFDDFFGMLHISNLVCVRFIMTQFKIYRIKLKLKLPGHTWPSVLNYTWTDKHHWSSHMLTFRAKTPIFLIWRCHAYGLFKSHAKPYPEKLSASLDLVLNLAIGKSTKSSPWNLKTPAMLASVAKKSKFWISICNPAELDCFYSPRSLPVWFRPQRYKIKALLMDFKTSKSK